VAHRRTEITIDVRNSFTATKQQKRIAHVLPPIPAIITHSEDIRNIRINCLIFF